MDNYNPKEFLLFALNHFKIEVIKQEEKMIYLNQDYVIEIEGMQLFKLLQADQVIAPFNDIEELCQFIKMDMQLTT